jgi:hypothetical protein
MRNFRTILILLTLATPSTVFGQKIQAGTWTGTITPPNSNAVEVTFEVTVAGDSTKITAKGTPRGDLPFANVHVAADRVTFDFNAGETISCTLMRQQGGGYKGNCLDSAGGTGVIEMLPPKKGPAPQAPGRASRNL